MLSRDSTVLATSSSDLPAPAPASVLQPSDPNDQAMVADTNLPPCNVSATDFAKLSVDLSTKTAEKAMTSKIRNLLTTLPSLTIEKMPVPAHPRLEKFELFEELPREIQFMIYGEMMAESRCIKLFERPRSSNPYEKLIQPWDSNIEGQRRHPAIVHVSQEARQEALRFYTICYDRPRVYREYKFEAPVGEEEEAAIKVSKMELTIGGKRNTYFINFSQDHFSHGSTKFPVSTVQLAGPSDFNFEADVLAQVQNMYQRPCYATALHGFDVIKRRTIETAVMFRHKLWGNLRHVTLVTDEYSALESQDTLLWTAYRLKHEVQAATFVKTDHVAKLQQRSNQSIGQLEDLGPVQFQIHFKWKLTKHADRPPTAVRKSTWRYLSPEKRQRLLEKDRKTLARCSELYLRNGD
ncbi:hypothetical protein VTL71DRAFT_6324 [Oculimacula yallundae]|uniref:2EXR domain-containing protein n=1 Tax=Oculimacula yallundae TaxID=86028 RepID=A0ABR4BWQ8_9HELO